MLFTSATLALVAILPALASPIQKRYNGVKIRAGRTDNMCLSTTPKDGPSDGTQLFLRSCDSLVVSTWNISPGSGSVILANSGVSTAFALDAGVPQMNNARAKIWTSYPGSPQQTWYLTNDNRIAITGGNQCLDLETGTDLPQTYECSTGNVNQVWYIDGISSSPSPSPSPSPTATPSVGPITNTVSSTSSAISTQPPALSRQIRWQPGQSKCLFVAGPAADGTPIRATDCSNTATNQLFIYNSDKTIQLSGTNYCLDAGSYPSNGTGLKIWTCGGYPQQTWTQTNDGLIGTADSRQCIDIKADDVSQVQTWSCSTTDKQQQFFF